VSVVLPVKGCRAHSARNWRSQLAQRYAGPLEFLFVVDDAADPAAVAVRKMLAAEGVPNARVVGAPHAVRASQKICNLQAGVRAAAGRHKWVLCLDDDIELHPRSLADLVAAAEAEPGAFMATGAQQLTALVKLAPLSNLVTCNPSWSGMLSACALLAANKQLSGTRFCSLAAHAIAPSVSLRPAGVGRVGWGRVDMLQQSAPVPRSRLPAGRVAGRGLADVG